jgi:hypothetical protein
VAANEGGHIRSVFTPEKEPEAASVPQSAD